MLTKQSYNMNELNKYKVSKDITGN